MPLLERVATLLRANLNDLLDRAEDPETMLKQLLLDMENQLLQVKTQVAIALADQHLRERKAREQEDAVAAWHRKAELAVGKGDDALARAALERALTHEATLAALRAQAAGQAAEAEALRSTYGQLAAKLAETRSRCDLLLAQHRRARLLSRAAEARGPQGTLDRLQTRLDASPSQPGNSVRSLEDSFAQLERDDRIEQLLAGLKSKQLLPTG